MSWPALLIAPLLALAEQLVSYALGTPACAGQQAAWMHAVPLLFLLATVGLTVLAWADVRRHAAAARGPDADPATGNGYFIAWVATGLGALSSLAIAAMWVPMWLLSPCAA